MSLFDLSASPREGNPGSRVGKVKKHRPEQGASEAHRNLAPEAHFLQALSLERKRAERSRRHFLLMLLEGGEVFNSGQQVLSQVTAALAASIRETDLSGWYRQDSDVGVIFTEVNAAEVPATQEVLKARMNTALRSRLQPGDVDRIQVSFHLFPEATDGHGWECSQEAVLYRDVWERGGARKLALVVKRLMDLGGSTAALLVFSPFFALIAAVVKLTSKGPVLYRQVRIGQYGRRFTFLKFRSMYVNSSDTIHQEYVKGLIRGEPPPVAEASDQVYKIQQDPRITPLGRFLRKTSLDELPQFLNVLKGEMSLVGPRPPIPYELEAYDAWHRRRLLEAKPGVTGLWQVSGRSQITFDEMVRLDLRYARTWSLWLDLRILAQTPGAVLSGEGAY
jgi:lipopolysaccharide/colanic/teichoic acid biosynthesis glycosyltransferase